jgi:hypothetical protein
MPFCQGKGLFNPESSQHRLTWSTNNFGQQMSVILNQYKYLNRKWFVLFYLQRHINNLYKKGMKIEQNGIPKERPKTTKLYVTMGEC